MKYLKMDTWTSAAFFILLPSGFVSLVNSEGITAAECPFLCACSGFGVTCDGSDVFPEGIPEKVKRFQLTNSAVYDIPINAFTSFRSLQEIRISHTNISMIRACSFAELENLTSIIFDDVMIKVIEGNAFSNMFNISKIEFDSANISEMSSYAFHGLAVVTNITFSSVNISIIHPFAFLRLHNITNIRFENAVIDQFLGDGISQIMDIQSFAFQHSTINQWHCGTLSTFRENVAKINISDVRLPCDCGIAWLYIRYSNTSIFEPDNANRCQGTSKLLSEVTLDEICPTSSSHDKFCQKLLPTTPHICRRFFDSPFNPEEKVEYPSYFTKPPRNTSGGSLVNFILFVISLVCHVVV